MKRMKTYKIEYYADCKYCHPTQKDNPHVKELEASKKRYEKLKAKLTWWDKLKMKMGGKDPLWHLDPWLTEQQYKLTGLIERCSFPRKSWLDGEIDIKASSKKEAIKKAKKEVYNFHEGIAGDDRQVEDFVFIKN